MTDVGYFTGVHRPRSSPRAGGDRDVAALAARQHGVVAHRQLLGLGLSRSAIQHRIRSGRLHQVHVGAYAVGHPILSLHGRWMAAVLACGPGAVVSHRCAAALLGMRPSARPRIDVTVPFGTRRDRPGIDVHRTRRLDQEDHTVEEGVPVTTVARTLLDFAEVARPGEVAQAVEAAERLRILDLNEIEDTMARNPGRHGSRPLGEVLATYRPAPATRLALERRFFELCRTAGLPLPAVNTLVAGLEVDAVWRDARLAVELDSRSFHQTRAAFERDRVRDATVQLAGFRILRLTHRRLVREPEVVLRTIRALLEAG